MGGVLGVIWQFDVLIRRVFVVSVQLVFLVPPSPLDHCLGCY